MTPPAFDLEKRIEAIWKKLNLDYQSSINGNWADNVNIKELRAEILALAAEVRADEASKYADMKDALEAIIWQFGCRGSNGKQPTIGTGGSSALELAFGALGWDDPHPVEDMDGVSCDVDCCYQAIAASG